MGTLRQFILKPIIYPIENQIMNARLLKISKTRYTWSNATSTVISTPLRYFYPEQVEDIQAIVQEAELQKLRVRAVGSGHSFSEAAKGDDFLMDIKELRDAEKYESPQVKASITNKHFVIAEAGITIRRVNRLLDDMGLALQNMGAVDFQTISGALMTGTHGTGIHKPAFPDMVVGLRVVGKGGKLLHLEPTGGITDPVYHAQHSPIQLIQDDDIFYSTVLSFGAMGIVYQMILEVVPRFWIHEHRYLENWTSLKTKLVNGEFMQMLEDFDFAAFRVNPYKIKGDHLCSIVVQRIQHTPPTKLEQGRRNILSAIGANLEWLIEGVIRTANRNPKNTGKKIQSSIKLATAKKYTDKSFKVLYQSGAAVLRYGLSSEFAFAADPVKIIEVLERIYKETEEAVTNADRYQPSHIAFRFVMPSKAYLSSAYSRPTVYVDVPTLHNTIGYQDLLDNYQLIMMSLGGIPHWGKVNNMLYLNPAFIHTAYPKYQAWIDVRRQMDPEGTFINDFIIKMGLV
jgi:FAD/FMN-containing dehydrogenase